TDLPKHIKSGLRHAIEVLSQVDDISFNFFEAKDVVRHPVVARIVEAYDAFEQKEQALKAKKDSQYQQHAQQTVQPTAPQTVQQSAQPAAQQDTPTHES
ncbi:MAG: PhoH family protein, partial [Shewanella sp.]